MNADCAREEGSFLFVCREGGDEGGGGKKKREEVLDGKGGEDWRGVGCALPPPRSVEATGEEELERNGGKRKKGSSLPFSPIPRGKGGRREREEQEEILLSLKIHFPSPHSSLRLREVR